MLQCVGASDMPGRTSGIIIQKSKQERSWDVDGGIVGRYMINGCIMKRFVVMSKEMDSSGITSVSLLLVLSALSVNHYLSVW